jgi:hypothetical protein
MSAQIDPLLQLKYVSPSNTAHSIPGSLAGPAYGLHGPPAATVPATHVFVVAPMQ